MQMSIAEHSTKNMEADGPQQKTTTPGAAPVISEQEIEWHGFTKNWDKTLPGRDESRFVVQDGSGFGINKTKARIHPAFISTIQVGGVIVLQMCFFYGKL